MLKCGGFHLTKFMSNSRTVLEALPATEISPKIQLDLDAESIQRALGISWDISTDQFTFSFTSSDSPLTKRGIVRVTCSIFDPIGFILPFILTAKILVQELWRRGFDWDELIDEEAAHFWTKWVDTAVNVNKVFVDRCFKSYFEDSVTEVQLHIFCDASEAAYGAVSYFRFSFKTGAMHLDLCSQSLNSLPLSLLLYHD